LAVDPSQTSTIYASTDIVFKSANGGSNWSASGSGLTGGNFERIVIDPRNAAALYVAGLFGGVFRSTDAGMNWSGINNGLPPFPTVVEALEIDPENSAVLYAGTFSNGIFKTTNGGATWNAANPGLPNTAIRVIVVDAANSSHVYAGTDLGVFKSTNGGASWASAGSSLPPTSILSLAISKGPPEINFGGVVNAASFALHPAPLAPGSIAVIFGGNLNDGSVVTSSSFGSDGKLVTSLGGASVKMNGIPAPLFYSIHGAGLDQLAVQVPFELAGQTSATVEVTVAGLTSAPRIFFLEPEAPGIFAVNQQGSGEGVITSLDGSLVSEQNPAGRGGVIVLYATGLGVTNPPLETGRPSEGNVTAVPATATIDGIPAEVFFSGTTPGLVGLNQINVQVPAGSRTGSNIPVVLNIAGKSSNSVTISVDPFGN
jgi:uncharacterized protein (TIGR03437 family)